jgi:hypothetical protein
VKMRITSLSILCLVLIASPAWAQWNYDNGPINGNTDAWTINFGYTVSDSFVAGGPTVTGYSFGLWEFSGDSLTSVDWLISTGPCSGPGGCGTILGSGTATSGGRGAGSGGNLTDTFISTNSFGYDIDLIGVTGLNVSVTPGGSPAGNEYWLTLANAVVPSGDPVFWDENSGKGCGGSGCPSSAYESSVGTIPSEAFTLSGTGSTPEPSSIMLFGSGILGLAGLVRRKLF